MIIISSSKLPIRIANYECSLQVIRQVVKKYFLAKTFSMYYPIARKVRVIFLSVTALLLLLISVLTFQSYTFAAILDPEAEDYHVKGYDEQKKGNFDKALTDYSKALSLGLETAAFYNDLGVLYEQLGLPDRAEEFYLKALKLDPEYLPTYTNLAYLYRGKGDLPQATHYLLERIHKAPEKDPWRDHLKAEVYSFNPGLKEQLEKEAQHQQAEALNKQLVQKAQDEFNLEIVRSEKHCQNGQKLITEKRYDEALEELNRALTLTPDNPKILKIRAQIFYERYIDEIKRRTTDAISKLDSGDLESAKKEFQHILTIIPKESAQTVE